MKKNCKRILSAALGLAMTLGLCTSALAVSARTGDSSVSVTIDGEEVDLRGSDGSGVYPMIVDGTTYLPLRGVSEALGMDVEWDSANRQVQVTTPDGATTPVMPATVHLTGNGQFGFGEGYVMGYEDNGVYTFKGIKFGNAERFKRSTPNTEYGTAENPSFAMSNGPVAPQSVTTSVSSKGNAPMLTPSDSDLYSNESECLNLNVWTDTLDSNAKKPVLVFIHGGGYSSGSSIELKSYTGEYFADYTDVVFVSANARLNLLGYVDLTAIGGESNLALSDMILSLEWVKDNIAQFGGDPDNITVMGQSGGGMKVSALSSSPKALEEGLFQRAVISSGFGASAGTAESQAAAAAETVANVKDSGIFVNYLKDNAEELGLTVSDSTTVGALKKMAQDASDEVVFGFLQSIPYDTLLTIGVQQNGGSFTADGVYFDEAGSFVDENGALNGTARNYSYLVGCTWGEFSGRTSDAGVMGSAPGGFVGNMTEAQKKAAIESYLENRAGSYDETKAAFDKAFPSHDFYDLCNAGNRINLGEDGYALPSGSLDQGAAFYKSMAASVNSGNQVYGYLSAYTLPFGGNMTMVHTVDLTYFFHTIDTAPYQIHGDVANARKVSDTMASALAAFCTNGNPSIDGLRCQAVTPDQSYVTVFDVESRCVPSSFNADLLALIAEE